MAGPDIGPKGNIEREREARENDQEEDGKEEQVGLAATKGPHLRTHVPCWGGWKDIQAAKKETMQMVVLGTIPVQKVT